MNKIAFIFPGQGVQVPGMGKEFYDNIPVSKRVIDQAAEITGLDMKNLLFTENEMLNITKYTQVALFTTSVAILRALEEHGVRPSVCAGLSLGEYGALVASGVMSFEDAIKVVKERGTIMQEEVPPNVGAMSAILGLSAEKIEKICEETDGIVQIANDNCPGQIVISGEADAVRRANESLMNADAKRAILLNVSGPFHSKMLMPAGEKLGKVLESVVLSDFSIPYVSNVTAAYVTEKSQVKELLTKQVYSSVRWRESVEMMIKDGVSTFIEIGPGKTLNGFLRKIDRNVKGLNIETISDLNNVLRSLEVE